jgi:predicted RNA-binding protein with PUA-like domain
MFIFANVGHSKFVEMQGDTSDFYRSACHKLKQVKAVIIICQTSYQSATMEQNYCSSKSIF